MKVIKLYRKPDAPEFYKVVRMGEHGLLVNYPIDKPNYKRDAKWLDLSKVRVEWVKTFEGD